MQANNPSSHATALASLQVMQWFYTYHRYEVELADKGRKHAAHVPELRRSGRECLKI
jgi:hypothetical protein